MAVGCIFLPDSSSYIVTFQYCFVALNVIGVIGGWNERNFFERLEYLG
jgi:hypothetical protein